MTNSVKKIGYTGKIFKVLNATKDLESYKIPDYLLECNHRAIYMLEKKAMLDIVEHKFDISINDVEFNEKNIVNEEIINNLPTEQIDIMPDEIEFTDKELCKLDKLYHQIRMYGERNPKDSLSNFEYNIRYKMFYLDCNKKQICFLLTLKGLLKLVCNKIRIESSTEYVMWIYDIIYKSDDSTDLEKEEIVAQMLNLSYTEFKRAIAPLANIYSAIYLIKLGEKKYRKIHLILINIQILVLSINLGIQKNLFRECINIVTPLKN